MKNLLYLISFFALFSCNNENGNDNGNMEGANTISVEGFTYGESDNDFETTIETIVKALEAAGAVSILTQVPFTENAAELGLELNNMEVIIFGNPALGTPLMQQNQLVGIDLPQKILVFQGDEDVVNVAFNNSSYLQARHGLEEVDQLATINTALGNFVGTSVSEELTTVDLVNISESQGIISKISTQSFEESYDALIAAITNNENLRVFATLDHAANAASINLELNPTRLVIFGNSALGTSLMQDKQTAGMDLPQKMLVWEDDEGVVRISYNNPEYLKTRHTILNSDDTLSMFITGQDNLSNVAAGL